MLNNWGCNEDYYLARYSLSIDVDSYVLDFIDQLLRINEKHIVHRLTCEEEGDPIALFLNDLKTKKKWKQIGINFPVMNSKYTYQFKYNTNYKVFVYDKDGALQEKNMELLGPFLRELYATGDESKSNMGYVGPLWMYSSMDGGRKLTIYILLHSDIYFPVVSNKFKYTELFYPRQKWVDNCELAVLNTNVFNKWFAELSGLFYKYGGTVEISETLGINEHNNVKLTHEGIIHL